MAKNKIQQSDMSMSEDTTPARQPTVPKTRKDKLQEKKDLKKIRRNIEQHKKGPLIKKKHGGSISSNMSGKDLVASCYD